MIKVVRKEKTALVIKTLRRSDPGRIRRRCSNCGLEWESFHYAEACPLRELETTFLSEDWFTVSREVTS
ncbi:MAG: hypothetical protein P8X46_09095 [Nitrospirales bacterium]